MTAITNGVNDHDDYVDINGDHNNNNNKTTMNDQPCQHRKHHKTMSSPTIRLKTNK